MLLYHYDEKTKEYLYSYVADADPEETKKSGHFVPLVAANSTLIAPPNEQQGKARVFNNNQWQCVDDYRGKYKINADRMFIYIANLYEDVIGYDIKTHEEKNLIESEGLDKYIFDNGVLRHKTQEELDEDERIRISNLTCTKRVFALMLQELGITYTQLKQLIASNEQAQLEWDLCVELLRSNPLLDIMASQLGVTSQQLNNLFKCANGEITIEEFKRGE